MHQPLMPDVIDPVSLHDTAGGDDAGADGGGGVAAGVVGADGDEGFLLLLSVGGVLVAFGEGAGRR